MIVDSLNGEHEDDTIAITGITSITINGRAGDDTITLDATLSTFSGTLVVNGGTEADAVVVEAGVTLTGNANHSAALDLQGARLALTALAQFDSLQDSAGTGAVNLSTFTLTVGDAANTTFDGTIGGTGGLTKVGAAH